MKTWRVFFLIALVASLVLTACGGDPKTPGRDAGEKWIEADGVHGSASPELGECFENATYQGQTGTVCRYSNGDVTVNGSLVE